MPEGIAMLVNAILYSYLFSFDSYIKIGQKFYSYKIKNFISNI